MPSAIALSSVATVWSSLAPSVTAVAAACSRALAACLSASRATVSSPLHRPKTRLPCVSAASISVTDSSSSELAAVAAARSRSRTAVCSSCRFSSISPRASSTSLASTPTYVAAASTASSLDAPLPSPTALRSSLVATSSSSRCFSCSAISAAFASRRSLSAFSSASRAAAAASQVPPRSVARSSSAAMCCASAASCCVASAASRAMLACCSPVAARSASVASTSASESPSARASGAARQNRAGLCAEARAARTTGSGSKPGSRAPGASALSTAFIDHASTRTALSGSDSSTVVAARLKPIIVPKCSSSLISLRSSMYSRSTLDVAAVEMLTASTSRCSTLATTADRCRCCAADASPGVIHVFMSGAALRTSSASTDEPMCSRRDTEFSKSGVAALKPPCASAARMTASS